MLKLVEKSAEKWVKCTCCGEQIRTAEKFFQVENNGKPVRGEKYCRHCKDYAYENNNIDDDDEFRRMQQAEREMETFAEYRIMGNTQAYFDDLNAGYI